MVQTGQMKFVGVDFSATGRRSVDLRSDAEFLKRAAQGDVLDAGELPRVQPAGLPVFANTAGDEFVVVPTEMGPSPLAWVSGSELDMNHDDLWDGGFVSMEQLGRKRSEAAQWFDDKPRAADTLRGELLRAILKMQRAAGLAGASPVGPDSVGAETRGESRPSQPPSAPFAGKSPPDGPDQSAAPAAGNSEPDLGDTLIDALPQIAIEQSVGLLSKALAAGIFDPAGAAIGAFSSLGLAAASFAVMNLLGGGPDDESSTAEWAATIVGPKLAKQLTTVNAKFFGGGPDKPFALRKLDMDDADNPITAGCATVLIEGMAAARVTDTVKPPGMQLVHGAMHVQIGGAELHAARKTDTESSVAPFTIPRCPGAVWTQIGGPTTNPRPPVPAQLQDWAEKRTGRRDLPIEYEGHDPHSDPPHNPCYVYNPETGEWNIWDGSQFSATLDEFESLTDIGVLKELFQKGDDDPNWYFLWMNLGSPQWPGAGTGTLWFFPDDPFGIDMTPYFRVHDWKFHPDWAHTQLDFWSLFTEAEIPAFFAGMEGRWSNPAALLMQIIYSMATSMAGISAWSNRHHEELHR